MNPRSSPPARLSAAAAVAAPITTIGLIAATLMAGCNIVGPAVLIASGPEKTGALYELPPDRSTVVFIDDRSSVLPSKAIRLRIAKAAEQALLDGGAVPEADVISSDAVAPVAAAERFSRPRSIADVGVEVGADVVVYATVDSFALTPDGQQYGPAAQLRVKVVDAGSKARLWPSPPQEWHVLSLATPVRTGDMPRTQAERVISEQDLADRVGREVGHLFVKHLRRPRNERIGRAS